MDFDIKTLYKKSEHVESLHSRAKNMGNKRIMKMCTVSEFSPNNFKREISFAKKAEKHGFGPKINSYGFKDKIGFMNMEKLDISLKTLIEKDKLTFTHLKSLKKVLKLMLKKGKFVHMDLHAENIWFNSSKEAKLIDFGFVKQVCEIKKEDNTKECLVNSSFDIHNLIECVLPNSKKKDELVKLKEIMQGEWISNCQKSK